MLKRAERLKAFARGRGVKFLGTWKTLSADEHVYTMPLNKFVDFATIAEPVNTVVDIRRYC